MLTKTFILVGVLASLIRGQQQPPAIVNPPPRGWAPQQPPVNRGQQPPPGPQQPRPISPQPRRPVQPGGTGGTTGTVCAQTGRNAVAVCFQANGGFQMTHVVYVLSNGSQGTAPPDLEQSRSGMCSAQNQIKTCIFTKIKNIRATSSCRTTPEFIRLENEAVGLVNGLLQLCGKGPVPAASSCLKQLNSKMRECYSGAGLNPDLYTPTGTQLRGAVIGDNKEMAEKFCKVKSTLFDCTEQVIKDCPGASEVLAISGYDHESLKSGVDVLCHYVRVYVKGLVCFQTPTPRVQSCLNNMNVNMTELRMLQTQGGLDKDSYHKKLCQIRVQYLACDQSAWTEQCEEAPVGLKSEFECNLLPTACKNDTALQETLQKTCAVQNYYRGLRGGAAQSTTVSSLVLTFFALSLLFIW